MFSWFHAQFEKHVSLEFPRSLFFCFHVYFFPIFLSLLEMAQYRLKYCLKWPFHTTTNCFIHALAYQNNAMVIIKVCAIWNLSFPPPAGRESKTAISAGQRLTYWATELFHLSQSYVKFRFISISVNTEVALLFHCWPFQGGSSVLVLWWFYMWRVAIHGYSRYI